MMQAPVHRPARSFSSARAQRWVLAAAIIVALTYTFRRIIEPAVDAVPGVDPKTAAKLAGTASPAPLAHWAIAYGAGFMMLALIALPAPELAASLSMLVVVGTLLGNGKGVANDLSSLEGKTPSAQSTAALANKLGKQQAAKVYTPSNFDTQFGIPKVTGAP